MPELRSGEVIDGIEAELELAKKPVGVTIVGSTREGSGVLRVSVEAPRPLDEGLEGARAWWPRPGQRGGSAEVLSVSAEREQIDLWQPSAPLPAAGSVLFLYPPLYLEGLRRAWQDPAWVREIEGFVGAMGQARPLELDGGAFSKLRARQREAFSLPGYVASFLHGPPGTGKTTTLGAVVAAALKQHPDARILLLSTTNMAVDEALFSVDRGLGHLGVAERDRGCQRIGLRFEGERYLKSPHLLPPVDRGLLRRRAELERSRPPSEDAGAYAAWKLAMEDVRRGLRQHLIRIAREARLLAMTTTHAALVLDALREAGRHDLLVLDEASQVSQAHALGLAPLAGRSLYAGDPRQLGPVVQSEHPMAQRWLRGSMFRWAEEGPRSVFLDEQSRMAPPICALVSNVFYHGKLRVAADAQGAPRWHEQRALRGEGELARPFVVVPVEEGPSRPAEGRGSASREGSAVQLVTWVQRLLATGQDPSEFLVLTPFRAQRALISSILAARGLGGVQVSTVHRAQGRERHTVLYDPADGASPFLQGEEAERLLNVALSRAQARLVLFLSRRDRASNPLLERVASVERHAATRPALSLLAALELPGFPGRCLGLVVEHRGLRLKITAAEAGRLRCLDLDGGGERTFDLAVLRGRPRT
ncbi:MAG: DNA2/NAM7 family helicase [Polyangiaceae bacterium]|jgi:hypothetical protein|nr:DNA2/NAM7 family helicase [Polyangiaceae bacterium]